MFGWYSVQSVKRLRIWRDYPFKRKKVNFLARTVRTPAFQECGGGGEFSSRDWPHPNRGEGEHICLCTKPYTRTYSTSYSQVAIFLCIFIKIFDFWSFATLTKRILESTISFWYFNIFIAESNFHPFSVYRVAWRKDRNIALWEQLFSLWRKGQKISRSHFVDIERGINKWKVF